MIDIFKTKTKGYKMYSNMRKINEVKLCLVVTTKNDSEKKRVLVLYPWNMCGLNIYDIGLIAEKDENDQTIYRSCERFRLIELDNNTVRIECEEYGYFVGACSFLNDSGIDYVIETAIPTYLREICETVNPDNLDGELEGLEGSERAYTLEQILQEKNIELEKK